MLCIWEILACELGILTKFEKGKTRKTKGLTVVADPDRPDAKGSLAGRRCLLHPGTCHRIVRRLFATSHLQFEFDALTGCCAGEKAHCPAARRGEEEEEEAGGGMGELTLHTQPVRTTMHAGRPPQKDG